MQIFLFLTWCVMKIMLCFWILTLGKIKLNLICETCVQFTIPFTTYMYLLKFIGTSTMVKRKWWTFKRSNDGWRPRRTNNFKCSIRGQWEIYLYNYRWQNCHECRSGPFTCSRFIRGWILFRRESTRRWKSSWAKPCWFFFLIWR